MSIGKPSIKNFRKPRPMILKVVGELLHRISTGSAVFAAANHYLWGAAILYMLGELGNAFTMLYAASQGEQTTDVATTDEKGGES